MRDTTFVIVIVAILLLLVIYLGNNNIIKRSNEVILQNRVNKLESKLDSFKTSNIDLYKYSMDLESICDTYKSSRDKKEAYHRAMPNYKNLY